MRLFPSQALADVAGDFFALPWPVRTSKAVLPCLPWQNNGNLGSYMFMSGGVWPQKPETSERLSGALCFRFFRANTAFIPAIIE